MTDADDQPGSDALRAGGFDPRNLHGAVIAVPLLRRFRDPSMAGIAHPVVIELNRGYPDGADAAAELVRELVLRVIGDHPATGELLVDRGLSQYIVARLTAASITRLVQLDRYPEPRPEPTIHRIWPDFEVGPLINRSAATVKADAARTAFTATGAGIVWAVVDSGIDGHHSHLHPPNANMPATLNVFLPVQHRDYTGGNSPLNRRLRPRHTRGGHHRG